MWVNHVLSRREMIMDMDNYGIIDKSIMEPISESTN